MAINLKEKKNRTDIEIGTLDPMNLSKAAPIRENPEMAADKINMAVVKIKRNTARIEKEQLTNSEEVAMPCQGSNLAESLFWLEHHSW